MSRGKCDDGEGGNLVRGGIGCASLLGLDILTVPLPRIRIVAMRGLPGLRSGGDVVLGRAGYGFALEVLALYFVCG